jgi:hypothetical protein
MPWDTFGQAHRDNTSCAYDQVSLVFESKTPPFCFRDCVAATCVPLIPVGFEIVSARAFHGGAAPSCGAPPSEIASPHTCSHVPCWSGRPYALGGERRIVCGGFFLGPAPCHRLTAPLRPPSHASRTRRLPLHARHQC